METTDKKVLKTCLVCKRTFLGWFSEKYCSADCRMEGNRLKARQRKRKSRKVGELKEGIISQQLVSEASIDRLSSKVIVEARHYDALSINNRYPEFFLVLFH